MKRLKGVFGDIFIQCFFERQPAGETYLLVSSHASKHFKCANWKIFTPRFSFSPNMSAGWKWPIKTVATPPPMDGQIEWWYFKNVSWWPLPYLFPLFLYHIMSPSRWRPNNQGRLKVFQFRAKKTKKKLNLVPFFSDFNLIIKFFNFHNYVFRVFSNFK
jgi:hypothetical protein